MSAKENKAIIRRLYEEVFQKRSTAVLDEVFAPDYTFRGAGAAPADGSSWDTWPIRGPEAYRSFMPAFWEAFPDFTITIEQMIAEGDKVVTVSTQRGTHQGDFAYGPAGPIRATGRRYTVPDVIVSRFVDGKIVEEWESFNFGSLWQQLGAIPSPEV